ncbi:MAG: hypothetical protein E7588_01845 [Ruminococcaceae bacterium]|nr:hypothetical protein [Oscillospiraceae bacterium]
MSFFKKVFRAKPTKREICSKLDNRKLQYVTERLPDGEIVVGKSGYINVRDGQMIIFCEGKNIFRSDIDATDCADLLSLAGVIINGFDLETEKERTLVAYYLYYRK